MPIRNARWLPSQVIVLTQDHMGKYRDMFFSEAITLIEPKLCINHLKILYNLCVFYVDWNFKMTTTAGHNFYIGPIGSFFIGRWTTKALESIWFRLIWCLCWPWWKHLLPVYLCRFCILEHFLIMWFWDRIFSVTCKKLYMTYFPVNIVVCECFWRSIRLIMTRYQRRLICCLHFLLLEKNSSLDIRACALSILSYLHAMYHGNHCKFLDVMGVS